MKPLTPLLNGGAAEVAPPPFHQPEGRIENLVEELYQSLQRSRHKHLVRPFHIVPAVELERESLEALFDDLVDTWEHESAALAFVTRKAMHPTYQRIIGMGAPAVPLILRRLERDLGHWFWALQAITGEDPAADTDSMEEARWRWVAWGRERGLV